MNNCKKLLINALTIGVLSLGSAFLAHNSFANGANGVSNGAQLTHKEARHVNINDFEGEEVAPTNELGCSIAQSNTTPTSQLLSFTFRSKSTTGYLTAKRNFIVQPDDDNYVLDDQGNPIITSTTELIEIDDKTLPIYNATLVYILGSTSGSSNKEIYVPETMTRSGQFAMRITAISEGCVSATGSQFASNYGNVWEFNGVEKITEIHIPSTIKSVASGAFQDVPESVNFYYEGEELSEVFAEDWTDCPASQIYCTGDEDYKEFKDSSRDVGVGGTESIGEQEDFILGYRANEVYPEEKYNKPLTIQYDIITVDDNGHETVETRYEELDILSTNTPYDGVGSLARSSYGRDFDVKLEENQYVDDTSVVFHNIYKVDTSRSIYGIFIDDPLYIRPSISYSTKQDISGIISYHASFNSTFMGYSLFSMTMDKNLSIVSEKYPEPHSLYLDIMSNEYETHINNIKSGKTYIRYLLYNLYSASYHFIYQGDNGLEEVTIPISTSISYQLLSQDRGNSVSILLKNSDVASDFSAEKVVYFEITNLTLYMDLFGTSDSGAGSKIAKTAVSYKFGYVEVFSAENGANVFNWNAFIFIFLGGYIVVYAAAAYLVFRILKEKFKNDEFRRIKPKKFLKQAILGGLGLGEVLYAIIFIVMRTTGFRNTIVVFNPVDPLLIGFTIFGLIITGYFIVQVVKFVKAENERRKVIRLHLNEDVDEDGTN